MHTLPTYDTVIYHANCYDGFTAAWVAHAVLGSKARYLPAKYGDPAPNVTDQRVLIADFSYPRDVLEVMHKTAAELVVLDHHATAKDDLAGLSYAQFDMERSGAGMTWDHFHPNVIRPPIVRHVEDRDLWLFRYVDTRNYHAAMSAYPMTFASWDEIASTPERILVKAGAAINRFIFNKVCLYADRAVVSAVDEVPAWVVSCPIEFVSECGNELIERANGPDVAVLWSYDNEQHMYYFSLRSDGEVHVGNLAKKFGGGGHAKAAGFRLDHLPEEWR